MSDRDVDLLWRVCGDAPMGRFMREYWAPVLRSDALVADGAPRRVRIYGENLVAFRDSQGRVGVLDEACPHRCTSLTLARNEESGLRCVYHGWKMDVFGKVLETPNDPGRRLDRIKVRWLPVREAAGMVWVWPGDGEAPPFPSFVFNDLEHEVQVRTYSAVRPANWFQLMENLWDSTHVPLLHGPGLKENFAGSGTALVHLGSPVYESDNTAPKRPLPPDVQFEVEAMDFGFRSRNRFPTSGISVDEWKATVMPFWVFFAAAKSGMTGEEDGDKTVGAFVPVDDEHTLCWNVVYNPTQPLGEAGRFFDAEPPDDFVPEWFCPQSSWGQDREAMAERRSYTGIGMGLGAAGTLLEDYAAVESMGPIVDRSKENLGPADILLVKGRRIYAQALRDYLDGRGALGTHVDVARISLPDGPETDEPESLSPSTARV